MHARVVTYVSTSFVLFQLGCGNADPNAMPTMPPAGVVRVNLDLHGACADYPRGGPPHIRRNGDELVLFYTDEVYRSTSIGVRLKPFRAGADHELSNTQHSVRIQRDASSSSSTPEFTSIGGRVTANAFDPENGAMVLRFHDVALAAQNSNATCTLSGILAFRGFEQ